METSGNPGATVPPEQLSPEGGANTQFATVDFVNNEIAKGQQQTIQDVQGLVNKVGDGIQQLAHRAGTFQREVKQGLLSLETAANEKVRAAESSILGTGEDVKALLQKAGEDVVYDATARIQRISSEREMHIIQVAEAGVQQVGEAVGAATAKATLTITELQGTTEQASLTAERLKELQTLVNSGNIGAVKEALGEMLANGDPEVHRLKRAVRMQDILLHKHTPLLRAAIGANVPVWLYGEAGSGKSMGVQIAADERDLQHFSQIMGPQTMQSQLFGFYDAHGKYHSTDLRRVFEHGGVFVFDEIDNSNPGVLTAMNNILAANEFSFPDGVVQKHPNARFAAAANTVGQGATAEYSSRVRIDEATRDRFAFVPWDTDKGLLNAILFEDPDEQSQPVDVGAGGVPTLSEWHHTFKQYRSAFSRLNVKANVGQRVALYGKALLQEGVGMDWLKEMLIFKGMPAAQRDKIERAL